MQLNPQVPSDIEEHKADVGPRLVELSPDDLQPHSTYLRHRISVSASQLSVIAALGEFAFHQPIMITKDRTIIDGYARWDLARRQGRPKILCIEYALSEADALRWLVLSHRPSHGFSAYSRALLALELEPLLKERARANQRTGGQKKGSSNLTKAERLDVRKEVAAIAGISTGTLTKIKQIIETGSPPIQEAVRTGEISIHKAWQWSRLSLQQQLRAIEEHRSRGGLSKTSRRLIQKHVAALSARPSPRPGLGALLTPLVPEHAAELDTITVTEIDSPGTIAYFTKNAVQVLQSLQEQNVPRQHS